LREYQKAYDEIKKAGGEILAISNDSPADLKAGAEQSGVKFMLLSDPKALVIKIYHLEHKGLNMRDPDQTGARPAVFFLNSDLTLSSAYQPEDMRYHLTPDELLARFKAAK
jgi:peroxiredoxin